MSFGGLVREAVFRALDDAHMTMADIDAVVLGKAPDLFEGVMKPELYLSDALGAVGKPMFRVHTAGSVGGTTGIVAASHVQAGKHRTVLAVAFEKQSEGNAQFALGSGKGASLGAGGAFAPFIRAYIHRSGAPEHIGWKVAVKDRLNALEEPVRPPEDRGHLDREGEGVTDDVGPDPVPRVVPVAPTAPARSCSPTRPAATRPRPTASAGVDPRRVVALRAAELPRPRPGAARRRACVCADDVYTQAGITDPRTQIDMAELYVPFSWHEAIWLEAHDLCDEGDGWKLIDDGTTELDGRLPINARAACSRATRSARPGSCASPRRRTRCAAPPASTRSTGRSVALAMAYGANSQYFSMWVVGS